MIMPSWIPCTGSEKLEMYTSQGEIMFSDHSCCCASLLDLGIIDQALLEDLRLCDT